MFKLIIKYLNYILYYFFFKFTILFKLVFYKELVPKKKKIKQLILLIP